MCDKGALRPFLLLLKHYVGIDPKGTLHGKTSFWCGLYLLHSCTQHVVALMIWNLD